MKVLILAGGFGTRLSEYTERIPKPLVPIGGRPIIWHIMAWYASYGHKDFYVALGDKAELIKDYFLNYRTLNSDFTVDMGTGRIEAHQEAEVDWKVTLVDTGIKAMTGGRVKAMEGFIGQEPFMLTYGDGVSNVDINALINFHEQHGKLVTVTAVRPIARFGELTLDEDRVSSFREKPQLQDGWINGGFFVINPGFFDLIPDSQTILEREPLDKVASQGEFRAYRHDGFWKCMDTKRDHEELEKIWKSGSAPWAL